MKPFKEFVKTLTEKSTKTVVERRKVPDTRKYYYGAVYNSTPDATHNGPDASADGGGGGE
jgi:hypothetical protein